MSDPPKRPFLDPPQRRYFVDPTYKALVDSLERLIHACELTPSEVREAAVLACIHYETRNVRGIYKGLLGMREERKAVYEAEERIRRLREWIDANPLSDE